MLSFCSQRTPRCQNKSPLVPYIPVSPSILLPRDPGLQADSLPSEQLGKHRSHKEFVSKTYQELSKLTNKKTKLKSKVAQLCPTLCNPMDCSLPRFSVHGIFQARLLEWVEEGNGEEDKQPHKNMDKRSEKRNS